LQLSQLIDERWILLKSDELDERLLSLQSLMFKKQPRKRTDWLDNCIRTESVEAVRSLVAAGQGICLLPNYLFRHWSLDGARIEARTISPMGNAEFADTVGLYWRQGAAISPYIKHLIRLAQH
jgi:DNA-binding transcriptional LysR family regulator